MPLPDTVAGARSYFSQQPETIPGLETPSLFNVDGTLDKLFPDHTAEDRQGFGATFSRLVPSALTSFRVAPLELSAGINKGLGHLMTTLDTMSDVISDATGWKEGGLWHKAGKVYQQNAQLWSDKARAQGASALDELVGQVVGGLPIGIFTWKLRWPFAALAAGTQAYESDEKNPVVRALTAAMEWKVLDKLLTMTEPLKWYLRIPTNMDAFGLAAMGEGAPSEEVLAQMGLGGAMAAYMPDTVGERYGLNELAKRLQGVYSDWKEAASPYYLPRTEGGFVGPLYHGTRKKFEKFSTEYVGEGQGAQSFGWGLYFTTEKGIAQHYAEEMSMTQGNWTLEGKRLIDAVREKRPDLVEKFGDLVATGTETILETAGGKEGAIKQLNSWLESPVDSTYDLRAADRYQAIKEILESGEFERQPGGGVVHEVTLHRGKTPDEYDYLRWDENITDRQRGKINAELKKEGITWTLYPETKGALPADIGPEPGRFAWITGKDIYQQLSVHLGKTIEGPPHPEWMAGEKIPGDQAASLFLLRAGIDGIKYPAGTLGGKPEGAKEAFNYVVFDDRAVSMGPPEEGVPSGVPGVQGPPPPPPIPPSPPVQPPGFEEPPPDGKGKQRRFLQTVAQAAESTPELVKGVKEIEPQDYDPQTKKEWVDYARQRVAASEEEAMSWVLSETPLSGEKTATVYELYNKLQNEGRTNEAVDMIEQYDKLLREGGRGVEAVTLWGKVTPPGFLRWCEKQIELVNQNRTWLDSVFGRGKYELTAEDKTFILNRKNEINQIADMTERNNATLNLIDYVARKVPPGISEMIDDLRYSDMLSGPRTSMRNWGQALENVFWTRPWEIGTRAGIDWMAAALRGKERQYYLSDVPLYYKTTLNSIPNASNAFGQVMRSERLATGTTTTETFGGEGYAEAFRLSREKLKPPALTFVKRTMEAADAFNATLISAGESAVELRRGASEEEAYAAGEAMAKKYLYREDTKPTDEELSAMSKLISGVSVIAQFGKKVPVFKYPWSWAVPFIRIPTNFGIQMIEHSPLTGLRLKGWDEELAARFVNGSIITALGALAAYNGDTTLFAPSGEKEKSLFYGSGRRPLSFRVPYTNQWISTWYLGPYALAFHLPTIAKWYFEDNPKSMTQETYQKLVGVGMGINRFIASQTSSQSIGNFWSMMAGEMSFTDPRQLTYALGQAIPAHALLAWGNKWLDDVYRKPDGFFDNLLGDLPIPVVDEHGEWTTYSKTLPARMGPLRKPSERNWWNQVIPYDVTTAQDPFYDKMYPIMLRQKQLQEGPREIIDLNDRLGKGEITERQWRQEFNRIQNQYWQRR
jgi:hypothetical protein